MTSEERLEIAARLRESREFVNGLPKTTPEQNAFDVFERILACIGYEHGNIFDYLADLIELQERTCHVVNEVDMFGDRTEVHDCCGDMHTRDMFTGRTYPYCPNCGARVTGVDA